MKRIITYLFFVLLIVGLVFCYGFSLNRNASKTIDNIEVEFNAGDNSFLTHELVNKLLIQNDSSVQNQTKRVIDLHELENTVLSSPYIEDATVFVTPGGLLKTQVTQREPLARIINGKKAFYLDRYGVEIPMSENFSARVPLIFGLNSSSNFKEITQFIALLFDDEFLKKEIVSVESLPSNEYNLSVRSGDYKIHFGEFTQVDEKVKKIKAFYNKALADNTIKNYKTINVKYHNQVICTKQNQDGEQ